MNWCSLNEVTRQLLYVLQEWDCIAVHSTMRVGQCEAQRVSQADIVARVTPASIPRCEARGTLQTLTKPVQELLL
jgi:hypothetical protein